MRYREKLENGVEGKIFRTSKPLYGSIGLLFIFNTINFFLTNNPYRAYHSGHTAYESTYTGTSFFISPSYIVLFIVAFQVIRLFITEKKLRVTVLYLCFWMGYIIVSLINGSVFHSPITFLYDSILNLLTFQLAAYMATHTSQLKINDKEQPLKANRVIFFLVLLGIFLAYIQKDRYGIINLNFSRITRGEITYWLFLGLHAIAICTSLVVFEKTKNARFLLPGVLVLLFQMAFANRMGMIYVIVPLFVYFCFGTYTSKRILFFAGVVSVIIIFWDTILSLLGIDGGLTTGMNNFLNGRGQLWGFCFNAFKENVLLGAGANLTSRGVYEGAVSEVGLLKFFAENGIIVGSLHVVILCIAVYRAIRIIKLSKKIQACSLDLFFSFYLMGCIIPIILESHSRILNITDYLAWLSVYYLYLRKDSVYCE